MAEALSPKAAMLLCIDDCQSILEYEKSLFEKSGFIVVTTVSAREGLRLVTVTTFAAAVIDYHMPDMNGYELALKIRRIRPETKVIMFSGDDVPEETYKVVDAVISKAASIKKLLPTVTRLCS